MPDPRVLRVLGGTSVRALVWSGSVLAMAGAAHAVVNRRRLRHLTDPAPAGHESPTPVSVSLLIPARDESSTIAECIARARGQIAVPRLQIVVLDDHSGDDTAEVAARAADGDERLTIVRSADDPPAGWLGKPFACHRLAAHASGQVLVFIDADVRLEPGAIAAAVEALGDTGADLISAWPRQVGRSPLARLVQPLQQWSWLTTLPLGAARRSARESLVAANGQFVVMDADAYRAAGGHGAVRAEVLEDIGLARAFKRAGRRVDLVDASAVAACEMYPSDRELVDGYAKSMWRAFGGPRRGLAVGAGLCVAYVLPPAYAAAGTSRHRSTRVVAAIGTVAAVAGRAACAGATGGRAWPDSLAHPFSILAFSSLMANSVARHRSGSLRWRGRPVTVAAGVMGSATGRSGDS